MKRYSYYLLVLCITAGFTTTHSFAAAGAGTGTFDIEATRKMLSYIELGRLHQLRELFEDAAKTGKRPDVNARDCGGSSTLSLILGPSKMSLAIFKFLLAQGANPRQSNHGDNLAWLPIHKASNISFGGDAAFVEALLEHDSCMVNAQDEHGDTPLIAAVRLCPLTKRTIDDADAQRIVSIINVLVRHGAKLSLKNKYSQDVLALASARGNPLIIEVINGHLSAKKAEQITDRTARIPAIKAAIDNPITHTLIPIQIAHIIHDFSQDDI